MKLPMSWLRDWVEVDAPPAQVADLLTRRGFYVEGVETLGHGHPGVVVARVLEVAKHPNADKLSLCRVDAGAGELSIVCGAPNVHAGMVAPLATIGAQLPNGLVIKKSKIRGVESNGMICAEDEIGLGQSHAGIMILPAETKIGTTASEYFQPYEDHIFEIGLTPNRIDAMSHMGVARDVCAYISHHNKTVVLNF